MVNKITNSIKKFELDLTGKVVLTEAASGNYVVTSIIAALAGAKVVAITNESKFATIDEVKLQTYNLAKKFQIENNIIIVTDKTSINYSDIDIVTNTGFVRPIDKKMINKLSKKCVVTLMWEPWEYRESELDLAYCNKKGIKIYGTNESDMRLETMKYIGFSVLSFLLGNKMTPFSSKVLILGNKHFAVPILDILKVNTYDVDYINNYSSKINISCYQAIVIAEHENDKLIIGNDNSFIKKTDLNKNQFIIHICGNVDFKDITCKVNTKSPASFGYMSYTTDFIDNQAVIDLHTASLKVGEGMLIANKKQLNKKSYKDFMETNYPALAFDNKRYW